MSTANFLTGCVPVGILRMCILSMRVHDVLSGAKFNDHWKKLKSFFFK